MCSISKLKQLSNGYHISWFHACACAKFTHAHARNLRIFCARMCVKLWFTGNSDSVPNTHIIPQEITLFNLVTLTFDLWPWQSNLAQILSGHIPIPKIVLIRQTVQSWECWKTDRQTDRHTDGTDSITSTADAGDKDAVFYQYNCVIYGTDI